MYILNMDGRPLGYSYAGESIFSHVKDGAPVPDNPRQPPHYVYVMGPYTARDINYQDDDADEPSYVSDPLFDPKAHMKHGSPTYEAALQEVCARLRDRFGTRAFLATDIDTIPTKEQVEEDPSLPGNGMAVPEQSIAFAAVSDLVVFVLPTAGISDGVSNEVGIILGEYNLRRNNTEPERKPRDRLGLFCTPGFSSAPIDEIPHTYGIPVREFDSREQFYEKVEDMLANLERQSPPLPVYYPHNG